MTKIPTLLDYPTKRLLFASDLHLNFASVPYLMEQLAQHDYDALAISGDISTARNIVTHLQTLHSALNKPLFFVMGNHDYYHGPNIGQHREEVETTFKGTPVIRLNGRQIIKLSDRTALVGVDGWADGQAGYGKSTFVRMNDSNYIRDLNQAAINRSLFDRMLQLAEQDTVSLRQALVPALEQFDTVYVVTHVPPFVEASLYQGRPNPPETLPFFCSPVMGETLLEIARQFPGKQIKVLCGHTHDRAHCLIENIEVWVAGAEYYLPQAEKLFVID